MTLNSEFSISMTEEFIQRVCQVIAEDQHKPIGEVTIDKTFEELHIESVDGLTILFALENEFDITIPDEAAKDIRSVREMAEGVAKLLEEKEAKIRAGGVSPDSGTPPDRSSANLPGVPSASPSENETNSTVVTKSNPAASGF